MSRRKEEIEIDPLLLLHRSVQISAAISGPLHLLPISRPTLSLSEPRKEWRKGGREGREQ